MQVRLDLKLETLAFKVDPERHIVIHKELCAGCDEHPCIAVCPAGLYGWEGGEIVHSCEGCLECGSCRAICPRVCRGDSQRVCRGDSQRGALAWRYPRGGYGVRYRWG